MRQRWSSCPPFHLPPLACSGQQNGQCHCDRGPSLQLPVTGVGVWGIPVALDARTRCNETLIHAAKESTLTAAVRILGILF